MWSFNIRLSVRAATRRCCHVLYALFNWACTVVYGYQIYHWIRQRAWVRIPSRLLAPSAISSQLSAHSGAISKTFQWILNAELAYALCAFAMIFFCLKRLADKTVR